MVKPNVHTASRDELVEAGVRAELADEILKRRRKGAIHLEALEEVSGVGPATLEHLRQALDFREQQPGSGNGGANEQQRAQADERARAREGGSGSSDERRHREEAPARTAAAATSSTAQLGVKVARDTATRRSAEGTAELGQALTELVQEQIRHNVVTLTALSKAVDWEQLFRIQGEFLRTSLERLAGLNRRYLEASQAVFTAAARAGEAGRRDRGA